MLTDDELARLARLASSSFHLSTFVNSATAGPWECHCGERGDTRGGFGSCSRCGRKSREQIERDEETFAALGIGRATGGKRSRSRMRDHTRRVPRG